ncbi:MAG: trpA, partial [Deltaproteobacteria bacterium]|nr:trpA [Deltaproteobacteria bacterium]
MSRIQQKFAELKKRNEAALIPFITAGDPDLATTLKIMRELERSGADCIEL